CRNGERWENHKNFLPYDRDLEAGRLPRASVEGLDVKTKRFESLMLGLRLREGLVWQESEPFWLCERQRLAERGLLEEMAPDRWRITKNAVPLTNQILLSFL